MTDHAAPSTRRVLIVDDELHIRALLEQTLEDLEDDGVEITAVSDGEAGLAAVRELHPDLVFLDVMMPKLNGYDVCEAVKSDAATVDVTIVMLTAKGQEVDRERADVVGADIYATKPFDPDEILAIARRELGLTG